MSSAPKVTLLADGWHMGTHAAALSVAVFASERDDRVSDLHVWRVGPRHLAAIVSVVASTPRPPSAYKDQLAAFPDLAHVTVEVHVCAGGPEAAA
jgi:Co/Zn/Cd efflux system component